MRTTIVPVAVSPITVPVSVMTTFPSFHWAPVTRASAGRNRRASSNNSGLLTTSSKSSILSFVTSGRRASGVPLLNAASYRWNAAVAS